MTENELKRLSALMGKCKTESGLMKDQRQFIDPCLRKLKKQDIKKYNTLIRKHNWRVYL